MNRLFEQGYAVKARDAETSRGTWYLPHFGVSSVSNPGKLRLVFDAAAKTSELCLNDLLEAGPDLIELLIGVLLRFRQFSIVFQGRCTRYVHAS